MNQQLDPMNAAMAATAEMPDLFGEFYFDAHFVRVAKDLPKEPFDAQMHDPAHRFTQIKIGISPLPETGVNFIYEREFLAEFRQDGWLQVTLPSLRNLGIDDLNGINFVRAKSVKFGTYTNRDGEKRDRTAPEIVAVYDTQDDCLSAWEAETGETSVRREVKSEEPAELNKSLFGKSGGTKPAAKPASNGGTNGTNKNTALAFLPAIVKDCRKGNDIDMQELEERLASTPLIRDHFTVTSSEVIEAVEKALAESAF